MNSSIPTRKRDRFRGLFGSTRDPSRASVESQVTASAPPGEIENLSTSTSSRSRLQANHLWGDFLAEALGKLTADERRVIQGHAASNIDDTIRAAYNAAAKQKEVCEDKKWSGSDKAKRVLLWLDRFKVVGDVAANADPIHVGLPWAGIRMLLEVAVADSRQMMALVSGMDLALCIANRLRAYLIYFQRLPSALTTDNFRKALIALHVHVLRFLAEAIRIFSLNAALRKVKALWQDPDLTAFASKCHQLAECADIEATNCDRNESAQWKVSLKQTLQELDKIQNVQDSLDSLQVKVDLSKLVRVSGATFDSIEEGQLPQCLERTRIEMLGQIARWTDDIDGKCIFWLCGKAGTGKSTISRTVAQAMHNKKRLGASFFFKKGHSGRSDAGYFFPTIVAQIADQVPAMRRFIAEALDNDSFLCTRNLKDQFERLLSQPLRSVESAQLPQTGLFIVIDALDECQRNMDVRQFLNLLSQVNAIGHLRLRIFVTSRPELPIDIGFQEIDGTLHEDVVLEEAQATAIESDLRTYFEHRFTEIKSEWVLKRPQNALPADWPARAHIETLVALAVPLFIFASTVCSFIAEKNPKKRLQSILEQRHAVTSLHLEDEHKYLRVTYSQIIQEVISGKDENRVNENIKTFRDVVGSIVLLADPLSSTALSRLLQVDVEEIDDVLDSLRSVFFVPRDHNGPIRMLHLSFRDFLVDQQNTDNQHFRVNEAQTRAKLAQQCLRRLTEPGVLRQDICDVERLGIGRPEITSQHIKTYITPDIAYACKYWPLHFISSGQQLCDNSPVYQFLKTNFLHWLEALSWLGSLSSLIPYISDLLSVAKGDDGRAIFAFLEDAKRFVLKSRSAIDLAPLQVYYSAMIFAPMRSIVRQTFDKQVPKTWAQLPSIPTSWNAEILTLEGHNSSVRAVAFSPDGRVVASASSDNTLRLWDARSGEETHNLKTRITMNEIGFSTNGQVEGLGWQEGDGFVMQSWNSQTGEPMQDPGLHPDIFESATLSPDKQLLAISSYSWQVHLFDTKTGKQRHCLEASIAFITSLVFSSDSQVLASGSADGTVQLWDVYSGVRSYQFHGHKSYITDIAFAPNGQAAASASKDGTLQLWDAEQGKLTRKVKMHHGGLSKVAFSHDGKVVTSALEDQTVRSFDVQTGKQILQVERNEWVEDCVTPVMAVSPVEQIVATAIGDGPLQIWNMQTGEHTQTLEQDSSVTALVFSPSGQVVASAGGSIVWLWNFQTGKCMRKLEHNSQVRAVSLFPDEQLVVSTSVEGKTRLWNAQTGEQMQELETSDPNVRVLGVSPDGLVVTFVLPGQAQLWSTQTGKLMLKLREEPEDITAVVLSQKSQVVALATHEGSLRLWNIAGHEPVQKFEGCDRYPIAIAVSLDGQVVATASWHGTVQLWNVQAGNQMLEFELLNKDEENDTEQTALAFSPDGHILAVSNEQGVQLWNTQTGEQVRSLLGCTAQVYILAFSPDGQVIAGASNNMTIQLWNTQTGEHVQEYLGHTQGILAIAFSPDGQTIASASSDQTVRLWNIQHSDKVQEPGGHKDRILAISFSPDGRLTATASQDQTVRLWDSQTGKQMQRMEHKSSILAIAFSPDGMLIASALGKTILLWDAQTGKQTKKLEGHHFWVSSMVFSPARHFIALRYDKTTWLWNTQTGELMQKLEINNEQSMFFDEFRALAFSPDSMIIAAAAGKTVWLWNAHTGELTQKLKINDERLILWDHCSALAFSPDGRIVAAVMNEAIWLWNAQTGEQTQELEEFRLTMTISPDNWSIHSRWKNKILQLRNLAADKQMYLVADVDITEPSLRTIIGTVMPSNALPHRIGDISNPTISLELSNQWIRHRGRELLWLPHEYRGEYSAAQGEILVIGQASGAVSFFRLA